MADLFLRAFADGCGREFSDSVNRIESKLRTDPHNAGESRSGNRRVLIELPVGVEYRIRDADRTVGIIVLRYYAKRAK